MSRRRRVDESEETQEVNFRDWTAEYTGRYLQGKGLKAASAEKFREHGITGVALQHLTRTELEEMGIEPGECSKILDIIKNLLQMTPFKVFNDSIHGHLEIHPLLVKIIDTPQFQRLRNIKQLGGKYFVFPGASHNRFEHSIGVAHLAGQLVESLRERQPNLNISLRDSLCVQIAGLCHDLGHGPFSHLFDGMFIPSVRPGSVWKHEIASLAMFDHMVEKNNLEKEMLKYGLVLEEDLVFIKGLIHRNDENSYEGRSEDKSFLYEIVANKRNGIDVDKWDYFARDCHHLGIRNNFDHNRYIKFARVCFSGDKKFLCTRAKEWDNVSDMFHTRRCLHRRAYQHKVGKCVEIMITEALVKANDHITFKGAKGKCKMSEAIDDMEAYTKLTDTVFDQILNSSTKELAEARGILEDIICRRLYKCLGETRPKEPTVIFKEYKDWAKEIASSEPALDEDLKKVTLNADDLEVSVATIDFGMKAEDPMKNMMFYFKADPTKAFTIDNVTDLVPDSFQERLVRVYCKKTDGNTIKRAKKHFDKWCSDNGFHSPSDIELTSPELKEGPSPPREQLDPSKKTLIM